MNDHQQRQHISQLESDLRTLQATVKGLRARIAELEQAALSAPVVKAPRRGRPPKKAE